MFSKEVIWAVTTVLGYSWCTRYSSQWYGLHDNLLFYNLVLHQQWISKLIKHSLDLFIHELLTIDEMKANIALYSSLSRCNSLSGCDWNIPASLEPYVSSLKPPRFLSSVIREGLSILWTFKGTSRARYNIFVVWSKSLNVHFIICPSLSKHHIIQIFICFL